jgi:RHS repeat-associated protein
MQSPGDSAAVSFAYNSDAQRTKTTLPNGVTLVMDFEDKTDTAGNPDSTDTGPNRLKSIESKNSGGTLTKFSYAYTPDTALCGGTNMDTGLRWSTTDKNNSTAKYCYDALNRLTKASNHNGSTYDYTLDPNGNITKVVQGASTTSFGYDAANRLCWRIASSQASAGCTPTPAGATTYTNDATGNLTASSAGFAGSYNSKGQPSSMTGLAGGTATAFGYAGASPFERFTAGAATYTNNALGVGAETSAGATTYYRRDNEGALVSERLGSAGNPTYYYAFDGLGSVAGLTDSTGAMPTTYSYDPYGATTNGGSSPNTFNPWKYASSYLDSTGFYKMGMRYYSPSLMRWTQPDPQEQPTDPTQAMRFGYAGGDPMNNTDPNGMSFLSDAGHWLNDRAAEAQRGWNTFKAVARTKVGGCLVYGGIIGAAAAAASRSWQGAAVGFAVGCGINLVKRTRRW